MNIDLSALRPDDAVYTLSTKEKHKIAHCHSITMTHVPADNDRLVEVVVFKDITGTVLFWLAQDQYRTVYQSGAPDEKSKDANGYDVVLHTSIVDILQRKVHHYTKPIIAKRILAKGERAHDIGIVDIIEYDIENDRYHIFIQSWRSNDIVMANRGGAEKEVAAMFVQAERYFNDNGWQETNIERPQYRQEREDDTRRPARP